MQTGTFVPVWFLYRGGRQFRASGAVFALMSQESYLVHDYFRDKADILPVLNIALKLHWLSNGYRIRPSQTPVRLGL
jgi:hypothetical protein